MFIKYSVQISRSSTQTWAQWGSPRGASISSELTLRPLLSFRIFLQKLRLSKDLLHVYFQKDKFQPDHSLFVISNWISLTNLVPFVFDAAVHLLPFSSSNLLIKQMINSARKRKRPKNVFTARPTNCHAGNNRDPYQLVVDNTLSVPTAHTRLLTSSSWYFRSLQISLQMLLLLFFFLEAVSAQNETDTGPIL